ncbi:hypothetical protein PT286_08785 [Neisseriaceae bacterium ESL0693]|nr:hypothetical protein [Neisseriaceae bacterium ESL0693]
MTKIETILLKVLEDCEQMRQNKAQLRLLNNEVTALREQVNALQSKNIILSEQQKQLAKA